MEASQGPKHHGTTCGGLLRLLFPGLEGSGLPYLAFPPWGAAGADPYHTPPVLPPDLFAAAACLLDLSGAYHHVVPKLAARAERAKRLIYIDGEDLALVRGVAEDWRAFRPDQDLDAWAAVPGRKILDLFTWWRAVFVDAADEPVFQAISSQSPPPSWWHTAVLLLMAADEAARGVGFYIPIDSPQIKPASRPWVTAMAERSMGLAFGKILPNGSKGGTFTGVSTLSVADPDFAAVLPKARTAAVGCTMRSLSHHLALLPARGVTRASWTPYLYREPPSDERHLNLLLIPFPYSVPARAFNGVTHFEGEGVKWGFFDVKQTWLEDITADEMIDFIRILANEAKQECDAIHGVVLPELALNHEMFEEVSERLPQYLPEIELLIAGVSGEAERLGNFVSVTVYQPVADGANRIGVRARREKHHRWKLDRQQILSYGLEGVLSPSLAWWEDIDLLSRRVDFAVFRAGSVVSAMICEDLARIDPCQELLRAIGPNLVVALLMDAAQVKDRWPGRYATILAEDPGSAVLTLTSRALMARQNRLGTRLSKGPEDRVIALWRDDGGSVEQIECPMDAQAVRLTLSGLRSIDATLDGRPDATAVSWRYASRRLVRIPDMGNRFDRIVGHDPEAPTADDAGRPRHRTEHG